MKKSLENTLKDKHIHTGVPQEQEQFLPDLDMFYSMLAYLFPLQIYDFLCHPPFQSRGYQHIISHFTAFYSDAFRYTCAAFQPCSQFGGS